MAQQIRPGPPLETRHIPSGERHVRYRTGAIPKRLLFIPVAVFIVIKLALGLGNLTPGDPALVIAGDLAAH